MNIVFGGSSGLGRELAKQSLMDTGQVMIVSRNHNKLQLAKEELSPYGVVHTYALDTADHEGVKSFFKSLEEKGISIDHAFITTGKHYYGTIHEVDKPAIEATFSSNTFSYFYLIPALAAMSNGQRVKVIAILSTAALKGKAMESIYSAAKFAVDGYLEAVKVEEKSRLEIMKVYPGGMDTSFWEGTQAPYEVDTFMDPQNVAEMIYQAATKDQLFVAALEIQRK